MKETKDKYVIGVDAKPNEALEDTAPFDHDALRNKLKTAGINIAELGDSSPELPSNPEDQALNDEEQKLVRILDELFAQNPLEMRELFQVIVRTKTYLKLSGRNHKTVLDKLTEAESKVQDEVKRKIAECRSLLQTHTSDEKAKQGFLKKLTGKWTSEVSKREQAIIELYLEIHELTKQMMDLMEKPQKKLAVLINSNYGLYLNAENLLAEIKKAGVRMPD